MLGRWIPPPTWRRGRFRVHRVHAAAPFCLPFLVSLSERPFSSLPQRRHQRDYNFHKLTGHGHWWGDDTQDLYPWLLTPRKASEEASVRTIAWEHLWVKEDVLGVGCEHWVMIYIGLPFANTTTKRRHFLTWLNPAWLLAPLHNILTKTPSPKLLCHMYFFCFPRYFSYQIHWPKFLAHVQVEG